MQNTTIAIIGAGHMGQSLIGGLIADGYDPQKIWATHPKPEKLMPLNKQFGIHVDTDNKVAAQTANIIIFAVKPQVLKTVATELAPIIHRRQPLIISIAAGIRTTDIQHWLGSKTAIIRCMPNTPALIRCGATALYANTQVNQEQKSLTESIMRAVGITVWLEEESQLDTVTALSGSGPAYFFRIMESLEKIAVELKLPAEIAHLLTLQTALGAARMALESEEPIGILRKKVTSPGGTTECALQILENYHLDKIFAEAITAAQQRSVELAKKLGE